MKGKMMMKVRELGLSLNLKKPSKKRKSSTSEKKKSHSSSKPSPKKAKGAVTEDKVKTFLSAKYYLVYSSTPLILIPYTFIAWCFI